MRLKRTLLFLACAAFLAACENPRAKRMEFDKAAVQARLQQYATLLRAMDIPGIAAMYAPDGQMVNPKRPPVIGRDAIREFLGGYAGYKVLENTDTATSTLIDGDTSEQLGTYHQRVRAPDGALFETSGRLEIGWTRSPSGEWLIQELATFPAN